MTAGSKPTDEFNGAEQEGAGLYQVTCRKGRRWSTAKAYLEPSAGRPNLAVRTGALVERVVVEGGCAVGVAYQHRRAPRPVYVDGEVVLAGGAINSAQLLMLSGIGPGCAPARAGRQRGRRPAGRRPEPPRPPGRCRWCSALAGRPT